MLTGHVCWPKSSVPMMKAVLKPPSKSVVNASQVTIDAQLSYLSGGPAAGAPVKFRSRIVPSSQSFPDYDEFSFGGAVPRVGQPQVLLALPDADARYLAVTRDGQRFLVAQAPSVGETPMTVVTNWLGLLQRK